jgi:hypothetical protein
MRLPNKESLKCYADRAIWSELKAYKLHIKIDDGGTFQKEPWEESHDTNWGRLMDGCYNQMLH